MSTKIIFKNFYNDLMLDCIITHSVGLSYNSHSLGNPSLVCPLTRFPLRCSGWIYFPCHVTCGPRCFLFNISLSGLGKPQRTRTRFLFMSIYPPCLVPRRHTVSIFGINECLDIVFYLIILKLVAMPIITDFFLLQKHFNNPCCS